MRIGFRKNLGHGFYVSHSVKIGGRRAGRRGGAKGSIGSLFWLIFVFPFYLLYYILIWPIIKVFQLISRNNEK